MPMPTMIPSKRPLKGTARAKMPPTLQPPRRISGQRVQFWDTLTLILNDIYWNGIPVSPASTIVVGKFRNTPQECRFCSCDLFVIMDIMFFTESYSIQVSSQSCKISNRSKRCHWAIWSQTSDPSPTGGYPLRPLPGLWWRLVHWNWRNPRKLQGWHSWCFKTSRSKRSHVANSFR